jgi:ADP-ribosylglycohydrolase
VSPVGLFASTIEEALHLAKISAEVTHNHPEGIKGAQAVAACVFIYRNGYTKNEIKEFVEREFGYDLSRTLDEIRPVYKFDVSCQGSVPESIIAFLESDTLDDCVRNAISIGGDSDTIASIACAIYMSKEIHSNDKWCEEYSSYLTADLLDVMVRFENVIAK